MVKKVSGSVAKSGIREQIGKLFRHNNDDDDYLHGDDDDDLGHSLWSLIIHPCQMPDIREIS